MLQDTTKAIIRKPNLPTFKRRFWHNPERLDARPVAWSLRNHPEEWEQDSGGYCIRHKPSNHEFWVGSGIGFYRLWRAGCSCHTETTNKFQRWQQGTFHRAYRHWRKWRTNAAGQVHDQFVGHFVH